MPLYHGSEGVGGTLVMVVSGAGLPAPTFDPLATTEAIHTERATAVYGVPTMFIAQLGRADFSRFDFTSLPTGVMAGNPEPCSSRQSARRRRTPDQINAKGPVLTWHSVTS